MKLVYLFNGRLPTEKAHGLQIMKMWEAFARLGITVELVVPYRWNTINESPFDYYGVQNNFTLTHVGAIDLMRYIPERLANFLQSITSMFMFWLHLPKADLYYARDYASMLLLSYLGKPFVAEFHDYRSQKPKKSI